jgi:hypothetical protein
VKRRDYGPRRAELHAVQGVHVRPWAYGVRVINPVYETGSPDVAADASSVVVHATALGAVLPAELVAVAQHGTWSVQALTWLQTALLHATAETSTVADDPDVQAFRKKLHLLLDHGQLW